MGDYAVVPNDGCFGDYAEVVEVYGSMAEALESIRGKSRWQVIVKRGAEVGERVHAVDIGRVYHRVSQPIDVNREQIVDLRNRTSAKADPAQLRICNAALRKGSDSAEWRVCARLIAEREAR